MGARTLLTSVFLQMKFILLHGGLCSTCQYPHISDSGGLPAFLRQVLTPIGDVLAVVFGMNES